MGYELQLNETPEDGIKRIILEIIDTAVAGLTEMPQGKAKAVHNARKACKRIRAALRLVRDEIGEPLYQQENIYFRDASRRLAEVRDSLVVVNALDALVRHFAAELPPGAFDALRARLIERHHAISHAILDGNVMEETAVLLRNGRAAIEQLPITHADFSAVAPGLLRVYQRGRTRMAEAYATNQPEQFHDWRKRVKYLWYQLEMLRQTWPHLLDTLVNDLHEVSDYLGDAHDLVELGRIVQEETAVFGDDPSIPLLAEFVERWRADFESAARPLGLRLYAETPELFTLRIGSYWDTWRGGDIPQAGPSLERILAVGLPEEAPPELLSTGEAAARLGLTRRQLRRRIRRGQVPAQKIGSVWIIRARDLDGL